MVEFIMLVGLPGSGKSAYAKKLAIEKNAVILSSDKLREELFGYRCQDRNDELFKEMKRRTLELLDNGVNVIYDATNTNSKRRYNLLNEIPSTYWKECHYINTDLEICLKNDANREFSVGNNVIHMLRNVLHVPMRFEGWDDIIVVSTSAYMGKVDNFKQLLNILNERLLTINECDMLYNCFGMYGLMELAQDNIHHTLTVGRHSYDVYKYLYENYFGQDREVMLLSAILHDIGKQETKTFNNGSKYATFRGHDSVSAQIALQKLKQLGYPKALDVATIIQLHMRLSWRDTQEAEVSDKVFKKMVGEEIYNKLQNFRLADMSGR